MPALPPPVSALESRLGVPVGSLAAEDLVRAESALADATTLALAEVPASVAASWELDAPPIAASVVLKAARREYENPRGIAQETLGEHSVGLSESSGVYLTRREIRYLRRAATGRSRGFVGTVRTPSAHS
ncbi:hypothetical protein [Agromyces sp. H66]|uniref:hypothetical protein n=1 Tax=Agromyces sp. H66 TaxID=2529859 RepID=UPI0010AA726E|nr:hypothetical protein [Agromyces sp. H66]